MHENYRWYVAAALGAAAVGSSAPARADRTPRVRISAEVAGASADGTGLVAPRLGIGARIVDHVGIDLAFSGGSASLISGDRSAGDFLPSVEGFYNWSHVQVFGRGGFGFQHRSGANLSDEGATSVFGAVGFRFGVGDTIEEDDDDHEVEAEWFLGLEVRAQHVLDGRWLMTPAILPERSTIMSTAFIMGVEL